MWLVQVVHYERREMRVSIKGFGEFADTLHIDIPRYADWRALTGILSIDGVTYYYTQGGTIGVRYNGAVDPIDVAAQALTVIAAFCQVPVGGLEVRVKERFNCEVDEDRVTAEIHSRMLRMPTPPHVPLYQVVMGGRAPGYYLR